MKKGNPIALLPIGVFLVLYLGLGLLFEYGLHIPMGFYNIPIVIAFLVAILVACLQNRAVPFEEKLVIMGQGVGDKNIITMLLSFIRTIFRGKKGGQLGMGLLVGAMDIATANNTVAIVMANPIAKEMSEDYGISPSRTACLLDTFSCIFQGIIPYGAQMLVAISAAAEMGFALSAFSIMRYLFYPYLLLVSSLIAIFLVKGKKN